MKPAKITVEEFSTPNPKKIAANEKLPEVWNLMKNEGIRHVLVSKEEAIVGILSERDLTTFSQADDFPKIEAQDVMSSNIVTVDADTPLYEVALKMSQEKIGSTIVVDDTSNYMGIFTATDALNALVEVLRGDYDDL